MCVCVSETIEFFNVNFIFSLEPTFVTDRLEASEPVLIIIAATPPTTVGVPNNFYLQAMLIHGKPLFNHFSDNKGPKNEKKKDTVQ